MLPCFVDGGSFHECWDRRCTEYRDAGYCARSKCCQAQTDDEGREACLNGGWRDYYHELISSSVSYEDIGNFTTSQPSSAPSETTPAEYSIDDAEASPTAASDLPVTSSASISTRPGAKPLAEATSKMLAVTATVIGWLLFT